MHQVSKRERFLSCAFALDPLAIQAATALSVQPVSEGLSAWAASGAALPETPLPLLSDIFPLCLYHPAGRSSRAGQRGNPGGLRGSVPCSAGLRGDASPSAAPPPAPATPRQPPALPTERPEPPGAPAPPARRAWPRPSPLRLRLPVSSAPRDRASRERRREEPCESGASRLGAAAGCFVPSERRWLVVSFRWMGCVRGEAAERRGCWWGYKRSGLRGGKRLRRRSEQKAGSAEGLQEAGGVLC